MYEKAKIDPSGIPKFLDSYKNDLIFRAEEPPYFLYCRKGRNKKSNTENVLDTQEYEESGDADYIDEEEETSEDY